jgi:hypothetical protein
MYQLNPEIAANPTRHITLGFDPTSGQRAP